MSPHDLDSITYKDAVACWNLYQQGMAGPSTTYLTTYPLMALINQLTQITISINSKNYKQKPLDDFDQIFPYAYDILTLQERKTANKLSLGGQAALALVDNNAPEWLKQALQEEIQDARIESRYTD